MTLKEIAPGFAVAPQLRAEDVGTAAAAGFRAILCCRPDGEEAGQPRAAEIAAATVSEGLAFHLIPFAPGRATEEDVAELARLLRAGEGPILAYCRSGARAAQLHAAAADLG